MPDLTWKNSSIGNMQTLDKKVNKNINMTNPKYGL